MNAVCGTFPRKFIRCTFVDVELCYSEGAANAILWLYCIFLSIPKWLKPGAGGFQTTGG
ncbi:uncharacterized protein BDW70DRAFT_130552 [Aspergillus foveolatus]|uniref:uncharacterized protein n=1 Tax=Aspergillus foveolatus TaxID=210207 RepID=UPI003CCCEB6E